MKNLALSILDVENITSYLEKLQEAEKKLSNIKDLELFYVTIHFDVMDNKFVPNRGIDIEKIKEVNKFGYYVDTHLMVEKPLEDGYIDKALEYGCKDITIHQEIESLNETLNYLIEKKKKDNKLRIGIAIKPNTNIETLEKYIKYIDKILVMSVEPGFGGQSYLSCATEKIAKLKEKYPNIFIQVDGGVNSKTLKEPLNANADSFVIGSYLTKNVEELQDKLNILNIILDIETTPKEANLEFEKRTVQAVEGGYAQGDILLGIRVPKIRRLAKIWYKLASFNVLDFFIKSKIHDYRRFAIFCLVNMVNKDNRNEVKEFIDKNLEHINNWDLVDSLAPICIGKELLNESDKHIYNVLRSYTKSSDIWTKRIGIVSLLYIAKENRKEVVFRVLDDVFFEEYHLYQKATGWVLRELYKVNPKDTLNYLIEKKKENKIPSILKSYATEKMSNKEKEMLK